MNEVNKTLYIPLYGKSKSKWLAYNMAMRARVFDDWTKQMLQQHPNAIVLHLGCGLDSRYKRICHACTKWIDGDFPEVLAIRRQYFPETENYHMQSVDISQDTQVAKLPDAECAIVILEGISMYLTEVQLKQFFIALQKKYPKLHILMDVYTEFSAKASKYKNPVNDVGVTTLYGMNDVKMILLGTRIRLKAEHTMTPVYLVKELKGFEQTFFKAMFTGKLYRKLYRLYELEA